MIKETDRKERGTKQGSTGLFLNFYTLSRSSHIRCFVHECSPLLTNRKQKQSYSISWMLKISNAVYTDFMLLKTNIVRTQTLVHYTKI